MAPEEEKAQLPWVGERVLVRVAETTCYHHRQGQQGAAIYRFMATADQSALAHLCSASEVSKVFLETVATLVLLVR